MKQNCHSLVSNKGVAMIEENNQIQEVCDLCGLPTEPFEQRSHLRCLSDEKIRSDIQSLVITDDCVLGFASPANLAAPTISYYGTSSHESVCAYRMD
jgi:hypothetical protein